MGKFSKYLCSLLVVVFVTSATFKLSEGRESSEDMSWDAFGSEETIDAGFDSIENQGETAEGQSHHDHHHHLHSAGVIPNLNSNPDPKQGVGLHQHGSNFAALNETCSPTGKKCSSAANHICSPDGRCVCTSGYIYERSTENCWVIPKADDPCAHDVQCHAGKMGHLSRCSKTHGKCECYDYKAQREVIAVEGVCYIKKKIGELCNTDDECNAPIRGEAYCKPGDHNSAGGQSFNGSCQCRDGYIWFNPLSACLKLATKLEDDCKVDAQCRQSPLGQLSLCEESRAKCICYPNGDGLSNYTDVVYYAKVNKCFLKKNYNDSCNRDNVDECRASLGPDVVCGPITTEISPSIDVCHCPPGKKCRSGASANFISSVVVFGAGVIALSRGLRW